MRIARFLLLWLLALACVGVRAQARESVAVTYGGNGGTLSGGVITKAAPTDFQRLINGGTVAGDVAIRDAAKARIGSVDVDMVLNRRMPWQQVARAVAVLGKTVPYVATGVAFIELLDELRMRGNGTIISRDPGVDQVSSTGICWGPAPQCFSSAGAYFAANTQTANTGCTGQFLTDGPRYPNNQPITDFSSGGTALYHVKGTYGTTLQYCMYNYGVSYRPATVLSCPASVDALNPANSIPAGGAPGYDGKCRTGRYTVPLNDTQVADVITGNPTTGSKARAIPAVVSLLDRGNDLVPYVDTPTATGPGTVAQPGSTTTTSGPSGTTTGTSSPTSIVVYNGPTYTWNDSTVVTTTNGGGTTTTTTTAPPAVQVETCGLPGKPACKIDETGTPPMPPVVDPTVGQIADDAARRTAADAQLTDPSFGWFSAPPVVTCTPFEWPGGFSLNPCGPMEIVRSIMAYLWAIFAAWWSFGMVRRTIAGS